SLPEGRVGDTSQGEPPHAVVRGGDATHGRIPGAPGHELLDTVAVPGNDEVVDVDIDVLDAAGAEGGIVPAGGGEPPDLGRGREVDPAERIHGHRVGVEVLEDDESVPAVAVILPEGGVEAAIGVIACQHKIRGARVGLPTHEDLATRQARGQAL